MEGNDFKDPIIFDPHLTQRGIAQVCCCGLLRVNWVLLWLMHPHLEMALS